MPAVDADRARAVIDDLKQAAGHDQVLDEVKYLVRIGEVRVEERRRGETEERQYGGGDPRLKSGVNRRGAPTPIGTLSY
jgi:hypothetical protein